MRFWLQCGKTSFFNFSSKVQKLNIKEQNFYGQPNNEIQLQLKKPASCFCMPAFTQIEKYAWVRNVILFIIIFITLFSVRQL